MDSVLVEKITRLVLAKLEERPTALPLTPEELRRWQDISASIQGTKAANPAADAAPRPLSREELKRWNEITASMQGTKAGGQVTFYRYNQ
ncbi:hypothetical protein [Brevibacillus agri]|uniref:hypothetical protein n=1 Tax=Brevibacillus agri TaxID=51101 RepID=UPI001EE63323|nr:hypothetical protein [Brevibacillus agri]MCG5253361.1 hypothetical protein [Brevibacillus agri]MDR9505292.1 hypothetical protein [Brevibacillus agri]MED1825044.1 hypothetical protein [Brevibacillus agri]